LEAARVQSAHDTGTPVNRELWEQLHSQARFRPQYPSEPAVQFLARLNLKGKFLDFGCGAGRHMKLAKELGYEVYGSDISSVAHTYASQWGEIGEISEFPADFFDAILCYGVLYYLPASELESTISELRRVLKGQMLLVLRSEKDYRIQSSKPLGDGDYRVEEGDGRVRNECGMLMHFFSRSEILKRFRDFAEIQIDELMTTSENGKYTDYDYIVKVSK
jgi:SAM-dependent methyltransferase